MEKPDPEKTLLATAIYASPAEGLRKVCSEYEFWSGKFTENSQQMCYALIAANWVISGSKAQGLLGNRWAKLSVITAVFALGVHLLSAWRLSEQLRRQVNYGEADPKRWAREYAAHIETGTCWPYTDLIESAGTWIRRGRVFLMGASTVCLIAGAFWK
jgi:hypothetical protein